MKSPFEYTKNDLYELALREGNKRFGSECKHEKIRGGKCLNCLRKVWVSKLTHTK